jgi:membrane protease YdiL (CAAX protease family)
MALAYLLTWAFLGPFFYLFNTVYGGDIEKMPGWMWALAPLAFIGGWGPTVAALIMAPLAGGRGALGKLLKSLTIWRAHIGWYVAIFALPPLLTAASVFIVDRSGATLARLDWIALLANIPLAYALALPFGPLGEELGWRGFALPRLLSSLGPVSASFILGTVWTFWHVPMMLWSPGASMPSFMPLSTSSILIYWVQVTSITAMMTVLFLRTGGSVLLAVLAHMTFNTAESVLFGGLADLSADQERSVYLANVTLLGVCGLTSLGWLGFARKPASEAAASAAP